MSCPASLTAHAPLSVQSPRSSSVKSVTASHTKAIRWVSTKPHPTTLPESLTSHAELWVHPAARPRSVNVYAAAGGGSPPPRPPPPHPARTATVTSRQDTSTREHVHLADIVAPPRTQWTDEHVLTGCATSRQDTFAVNFLGAFPCSTGPASASTGWWGPWVAACQDQEKSPRHCSGGS